MKIFWILSKEKTVKEIDAAGFFQSKDWVDC